MSMAASLAATLHPTFGAAGDAPRTALSGRAMVFAVVGLRGPSAAPRGPLGGHREHAADTRRVLSDEAVKWKMLPARKPEEPKIFAGTVVLLGCAGRGTTIESGRRWRSPG